MNQGRGGARGSGKGRRRRRKNKDQNASGQKDSVQFKVAPRILARPAALQDPVPQPELPKVDPELSAEGPTRLQAILAQKAEQKQPETVSRGNHVHNLDQAGVGRHPKARPRRSRNQAEPKPTRPSTSIAQAEAKIAQSSVLSKEAKPFVPREVRNVIQFVDGNMKIHTDAFAKLLQEQNDFTVIGVVGKAGVGKSTILSSFCRFYDTKDRSLQPLSLDQITSYSLKSYLDLHGDTEHEYGAPKGPPIFPVHSMLGEHTEGIQAFVTTERTILLDCQPLLSSDLVFKMLSTDLPLPQNCSYMSLCRARSLRMLAFLQAVCHTLLVVEDTGGSRPNPAQCELHSLFASADLVSAQLTTKSLLEASCRELTKKQRGSDTEEKKTSSPDRKRAPNTTEKISIAKLSYRSKRQPVAKADLIFVRNKAMRVPDCTLPECENSFTLPRFDTRDRDTRDTQYHIFQRQCCLMRDKILRLPKRRYVSDRKVSERDWLRHSVKIWEELRSNSIVVDFRKKAFEAERCTTITWTEAT